MTRGLLRRVSKLERSHDEQSAPVAPMVCVVVNSREELEQLRAFDAFPWSRGIPMPDEWLTRQSITAAEMIEFLHNQHLEYTTGLPESNFER